MVCVAVGEGVMLGVQVAWMMVTMAGGSVALGADGPALQAASSPVNIPVDSSETRQISFLMRNPE
jgi:hypothetical protein